VKILYIITANVVYVTAHKNLLEYVLTIRWSRK